MLPKALKKVRALAVEIAAAAIDLTRLQDAVKV